MLGEIFVLVRDSGKCTQTLECPFKFVKGQTGRELKPLSTPSMSEGMIGISEAWWTSLFLRVF